MCRKEINSAGFQNHLGVEEVDIQRKHAIAHYLDLVILHGRVDLRPILTHTFRLEQWRDAFLASANQASGAVKVAIDLRWPTGGCARGGEIRMICTHRRSRTGSVYTRRGTPRWRYPCCWQWVT